MNQILQEVTQQALRAPGWMKYEELLWLGGHARGRAVVIEVGAWRGRTTVMFAALAEKVFVVDTWAGVCGDRRDATGTIVEKMGADMVFADFCMRVFWAIGEGRVTPIRINSINAADVLDVFLAGRTADMIFIDADHRQLAKDLEVLMPLLSPGGLLCGHDYHVRWPEVKRDVQMIVPTHRQGPGAIWYQPTEDCP